MEIGVIGCGSMGTAIAEVLARDHTLWFYDRNFAKAESLAKKCRGRALKVLPLTSEAVLLAIKPQVFKEASLDVTPHFLFSIMTGTPISALKSRFPKSLIVRMMPNQAVRFGKGVVALAENPELDGARGEIERLFSPLGLLEWIPEALFDPLTSLTGSGPAFFYALVEAIVEAGVKMGFEKKMALDFVKQMLAGSLYTLEHSGMQPSELIAQISAPGGTTLAGLAAFKEAGVEEGVIATFEAACKRAQELKQASS